MLAIAGQTAGSNWLFFREPLITSEVTKAIFKIRFFKFHE